MKWLLILSVLLNIFLAYKWYEVKTLPPLERIIVEAEPVTPKVITKKVEIPCPPPVPQKKKSQVKDTPVAPSIEGDWASADQEDFNQMGENLENMKNEFLATQLGWDEIQMQKYRDLQAEFFTKTEPIYKNAGFGELSIKDRKLLLKMEEDHQNKVINFFGKSNWDKYVKFRQDFNKKLIHRQNQTGEPVLLMSY